MIITNKKNIYPIKKRLKDKGNLGDILNIHDDGLPARLQLQMPNRVKWKFVKSCVKSRWEVN